jgi:hypothetical protein
LAAALGLGVLGVALFPGCGKPPTTVDSQQGQAEVKVKPWETVALRLQKDSGEASARSALTTLKTELSAAPDANPRPAGLTPEAEEALAKLVPLSPEDRAEIRGANFTPFDAPYLAECLYLRDAARALDVPPRPGQTSEQLDADRADLAFAWVCRQVYLNPWLAPVGNRVGAAALPPAYVLRRGYGSALERMYVFLALLQQMNLDGCLVGPPDARAVLDYSAVGPDKVVLQGGPRGPFWAVGVRVGKEVRLYDPWRGEPLPATLSKLRADPDAHKAWFEGAAKGSGVTADDARKAAVYLAVPVNALAPRLETLEKQLAADVKVELAVNPVALRDAFPDPKPVFWNPPADRFAYGRTGRLFLPADEGGTDRNPAGPGRTFEAYLLSQLPEFALPKEIQAIEDQEARQRFLQLILGYYGAAFIHPPPNPRETIQRGQFEAASRDLVGKQDQFFQGIDRVRKNRDADRLIHEWVEKARDLYLQKGLAATPEDREAAAAAVEAHWRQHAAVVQLLVDRVAAHVGHAEAILLLALCKHEQAEQAQARLEHAASPGAERLRKKAADAWEAAAAEWETYAVRAEAQAGFPGRAAHVRMLTERAARMAKAK